MMIPKISDKCSKYFKFSDFFECSDTYKICRSLNRSQKSIRNNLIRLGKIKGEITPKRLPKTKNQVVETETSSSEKIISYIIYFLILFLITLTFIIFPEYNLLKTILFIISYS